MGKKFVFYLKDSQKAITITDPEENRSLSELKGTIGSLISSGDLCNFSTDKDCLILKPDRIVGVWIEDISKGKGREETLNLDDLDLDIDIPDTEKPVNEKNIEVPPELDQEDLNVGDEGLTDILDGIEEEEQEIKQALKETYYVDDASPYNPNVPSSPSPPPPSYSKKQILSPSPTLAKARIPEHLLPQIEESQEVGPDGLNSDLLSKMGVSQHAPSGTAIPKGSIDPSKVPLVGRKQIVSKEEIAKNVINVASQNKKIVSVRPVRIGK